MVHNGSWQVRNFGQIVCLNDRDRPIRRRVTVSNRISRLRLLAWPLGLALVVALVAWQGFGTLVETVSQAGWRVVLLAPLFFVLLSGVTFGWATLLGEARPTYGALWIFKWIGFSTNWLLPVAQVGGDVARMRLLEGAGMERPSAIAGVVADKTVQSAGIALHALAGLGCLVALVDGGRAVTLGLVGALALAAAVFAFYRVQRRGLLRLGRWVSRLLPESRRDGLHGVVEKLRDELDLIYRRWSAVALAFALEIAFRLGITFEIMLATEWLGAPVTLAEALILEGVTQAARAGSFLIPGALGIQEGAYIMMGGVVGLPPEVALAASIVRRVRQLLVGLPGLVVWQRLESKRRNIQAPPDPQPSG